MTCVYVCAGELLAQQIQVYGSGVYGSEAGGYGQFVVQLLDLDGGKVTRGGAPLTVTISNADCLYHLKVHDNQDGSYFVHYMLYHPGVYDLHVRLNDEHEAKVCIYVYVYMYVYMYVLC